MYILILLYNIKFYKNYNFSNLSFIKYITFIFNQDYFNLFILINLLVILINSKFKSKKQKNIFILFILEYYYLISNNIISKNQLNFFENFLIINDKLLNGLMIIHPFLLFTFYIYLLYYLYNINYFYSLVNLKIILMVTILGAWWAAQELNWINWWSWDLIEIISLFYLFNFIGVIHFWKDFNLRFFRKTLQFFFFFKFLLFILLVRLNLINSLHSFISSPATLQLIDYFLIFIFFFITKVFFKKYSILLFYPKNKSTLKEHYCLTVIYLFLFFFIQILINFFKTFNLDFLFYYTIYIFLIFFFCLNVKKSNSINYFFSIFKMNFFEKFILKNLLKLDYLHFFLFTAILISFSKSYLIFIENANFNNISIQLNYIFNEAYLYFLKYVPNENVKNFFYTNFFEKALIKNNFYKNFSENTFSLLFFKTIFFFNFSIKSIFDFYNLNNFISFLFVLILLILLKKKKLFSFFKYF